MFTWRYSPGDTWLVFWNSHLVFCRQRRPVYPQTRTHQRLQTSTSVLGIVPHRVPHRLEMAQRPQGRHGNSSLRRADLFPQVSRCTSLTPGAETKTAPGAGVAKLPKDQIYCPGFWSNRKTNTASPSSDKQHKQPAEDGAALLERMRIHPEAQRVLGNPCVPVVMLDRLNLQSAWLSCLQPIVSVVRLPFQTQDKIQNGRPMVEHPEQSRLSENEVHGLAIVEASLRPKAAELPESTETSWAEPPCPNSSPSEEPEQDLGFDCESNLDQPYILLDSGSEEWDHDVKTDPETFYLDQDVDQTLVIELDPELESQSGEPEPETNCEDDEAQVAISDDHRADGEPDSGAHQCGGAAGPEEMESEDFCAVCLNGGDLLCCDRCPKVYHLGCHIPPLGSPPLGDWICSLCGSDQDPSCDLEDGPSCGVRAPYTLSVCEQRRCEKLTLLLFCHRLSAPFHEPVSPLARNYYQVIKRPVDLSLIRRKLDKCRTLHYFTAEQFVDDVLLMFRNCATFNYPDSEVAQAGRSLELFFLNKLRETFPDRTFLSACQKSADAKLQWFRRKRREHRRKKHTLSGRKYLL